MNVYIWPRIKRATDHYHCEGGVVVIAESEHDAVALAHTVSDGECRIQSHERPVVIGTQDSNVETRAWIMPDKGCCG